MTEIVTKSVPDSLGPFVERFASVIRSAESFRGDLCFDIAPESVKGVAQMLKSEMGFCVLMDLFGMDYSQFLRSGKVAAEACDFPDGLAVVYIFYAVDTGTRVRIRARLSADSPVIDSLSEVFAAANWFEREAFDLFGVIFLGHPNLTRILCHKDFSGHPLRKDYPADGYQRLKSAAPSSEL